MMRMTRRCWEAFMTGLLKRVIPKLNKQYFTSAIQLTECVYKEKGKTLKVFLSTPCKVDASIQTAITQQIAACYQKKCKGIQAFIELGKKNTKVFTSKVYQHLFSYVLDNPDFLQQRIQCIFYSSSSWWQKLALLRHAKRKRLSDPELTCLFFGIVFVSPQKHKTGLVKLDKPHEHAKPLEDSFSGVENPKRDENFIGDLNLNFIFRDDDEDEDHQEQAPHK